MSIFNKVTKSFQWGQHKVTMETGEIARQAGGAVLVDMDGTVVLATVVAKTDAKPGQDFFPLTVDDLRRRPHSRQLLQARRPPERIRNADLAPDRPPDSPIVP